jgi:hypothetical protein
MTNEQRFIASCESVGEPYVRQKLGGGRYSATKATWANSWLEQAESGKSEATKAEETSRLLRESSRLSGYLKPALLALLLVLLIGSVAAFATGATLH